MAAVTGVTVVAQALLHTFFTVAQMWVSPSVGIGATGMHHLDMPAMDMPAMGTDNIDPLLLGHRDLAASGHRMSLGMVSAHAVAAVICGLWLWRGETACFRLLRSLSVRIFAPWVRARHLLTVLGPCSRLGSILVDGAPRQLRQIDLRHSVSRRGPPRGPAFC
jgi:hypothetical protein